MTQPRYETGGGILIQAVAVRVGICKFYCKCGIGKGVYKTFAFFVLADVINTTSFNETYVPVAAVMNTSSMSETCLARFPPLLG